MVRDARERNLKLLIRREMREKVYVREEREGIKKEKNSFTSHE
jgi:hypothetical protein